MNLLYPSYKDGLLLANFDWLDDSIRVGLYTAATVYNAAHTVVADLGGIEISPGEADLINKFTAEGTAISFPAEYNALLSPETVAVAVMYKTSNNALMAYMSTVNGFTFNPSGANYTMSPGGPNGAWFTL